MILFEKFPHEVAIARGVVRLRKGVEASKIKIPFGGNGIIFNTFAYIYRHTGNDVRLKNSNFRINSGVPLDDIKIDEYLASRSHIWLEIPVIFPEKTEILYSVMYIQDPGEPNNFDKYHQITSDLWDIHYVIFNLHQQPVMEVPKQ